ncbi:MAG TPA: hypothetical protein VK251_12630 [Steroidobacteraceae bacterium]|nr:hypothetical protein [Steroidobacteraceae bacterium]
MLRIPLRGDVLQEGDAAVHVAVETQYAAVANNQVLAIGADDPVLEFERFVALGIAPEGGHEYAVLRRDPGTRIQPIRDQGFRGQAEQTTKAAGGDDFSFGELDLERSGPAERFGPGQHARIPFAHLQRLLVLADVVQGDQIRRGAVELDFSAADSRIKCRTVLAPAADVVGPAGLALQA